MIYIFHAVGILCLINVVTGLLSGNQISEVGKKVMLPSVAISLVYVIWLIIK